MKFLLRLRHWQLFLLTWGLPITVFVLSFLSTGLPVLGVMPIMMVLFTLGVFGWVWAISTQLNKKLPAGVKLDVGQFKIFFLIPIVYTLGASIWMGSSLFGSPTIQSDYMGIAIGLFMFVHLFSMVCILLGLRFAAKTMKSIELGRMTEFGDYAGEFFLIWFSVAGVWVLQPRLNKLIED